MPIRFGANTLHLNLNLGSCGEDGLEQLFVGFETEFPVAPGWP